MLETGKLYKYTYPYSTGLYHSPSDRLYFSEVCWNDTFLLLEQKNVSTYEHLKILTSNGETGWITGKGHIASVDTSNVA